MRGGGRWIEPEDEGRKKGEMKASFHETQSKKRLFYDTLLLILRLLLGWVAGWLGGWLALFAMESLLLLLHPENMGCYAFAKVQIDLFRFIKMSSTNSNFQLHRIVDTERRGREMVQL